MNRILKASLLILAVLLLGSFPAQAVERPFSLSAAGTVIDGAINASGRATHLGQFTEIGQLSFVLDPNNPGFALVSGTATFTAANGDQVNATLQDASLDLSTGLGSGVIEFAGGTGRFEGASGSGNLVVQQNLLTGAFEATIVGTLDF